MVFPTVLRISIIPRHFLDISFYHKYQESIQERPIEFHFPLDDSQIVKLLHGVEFNKIITTGFFDNHPQRIHVKVYSADRVKKISWKKWQKLVYSAMNYPELMNVIHEIDNEND